MKMRLLLVDNVADRPVYGVVDPGEDPPVLTVDGVPRNPGEFYLLESWQKALVRAYRGGVRDERSGLVPVGRRHDGGAA